MSSDLFSLQGRVALVTGGSRGLGRMIAAGFLRAGARVYVNGRSVERCEAAAAELKALGDCRALPMDIGSVAGAQELAAAFGAIEAHLDILVNNAGAFASAPLDDFEERLWDEVMDLNLKSPFYVTRAFHAALRAGAARGPRAKVIQIASIAGLRLSPSESYSYAASKAGLIHLTRRLATRLAPDGIVVNALAPGVFPSDLNVAARDRPQELAARIPAGRVGGEDDLVGPAVFLASRAGDYVLGTTLVVDGGVILNRSG